MTGSRFNENDFFLSGAVRDRKAVIRASDGGNGGTLKVLGRMGGV